VPKKGSICPEMWTVRRIQMEGCPAVGTFGLMVDSSSKRLLTP